MSIEAVQGFINKINRDAELRTALVTAFAERAELDLVRLAGEHGFTFSKAESVKVWDAINAGGGHSPHAGRSSQ